MNNKYFRNISNIQTGYLLETPKKTSVIDNAAIAGNAFILGGGECMNADKNKRLNKYNIVRVIYNQLFGWNGTISGRDKSGNLYNKYDFDVSICEEPEIDITKTSGNFDFTVKTYQSRSENVYFYVALYDFETGETIDAGSFYIKNYTGKITADNMQALYHIIDAGTALTETIFAETHK